MTAPEYRVQIRKWFVETGYVDGNGVGLWDQTKESVEVSSKAEAEAIRNDWEASGKIERTPWGELRLKSHYGAFRIRNVWEETSPAVLAGLPEVQALIAAAVLDGQLRAFERDRLDTPDELRGIDAKAALDWLLREERNKALREAADGCRKRAEQVANAVLTGLPEQARLREAMDAAHSKDFHCILALIQEAPHDPA